MTIVPPGPLFPGQSDSVHLLALKIAQNSYSWAFGLGVFTLPPPYLHDCKDTLYEKIASYTGAIARMV